MTGDTTAPVPRKWDAIDDLESIALGILPGFEGTAMEAILAAADHVATHGDDRMAHGFADRLLDIEAHSCINDEWCHVCEQQTQSKADEHE